jgi:hypothetical protein
MSKSKRAEGDGHVPECRPTGGRPATDPPGRTRPATGAGGRRAGVLPHRGHLRRRRVPDQGHHREPGRHGVPGLWGRLGHAAAVPDRRDGDLLLAGVPEPGRVRAGAAAAPGGAAAGRAAHPDPAAGLAGPAPRRRSQLLPQLLRPVLARAADPGLPVRGHGGPRRRVRDRASVVPGLPAGVLAGAAARLRVAAPAGGEAAAGAVRRAAGPTRRPLAAGGAAAGRGGGDAGQRGRARRLEPRQLRAVPALRFPGRRRPQDR